MAGKPGHRRRLYGTRGDLTRLEHDAVKEVIRAVMRGEDPKLKVNKSNVLSRPQVRQELQFLFQTYEGTRLSDLAAHLKDVLEANQEKVLSDGKTVNYTDLNIKARGVELLGKFYGAFAPEQEQHEHIHRRPGDIIKTTEKLTQDWDGDVADTGLEDTCLEDTSCESSEK